MPASAPETGRLRTRDGVELFYRVHAVREARAWLVLVHGFADHSERYLHVFARLKAVGIACLGFDLRGHGSSPGRRGHVRRFDEYLCDLDAAIALARERAAGTPLLLLGHSLGGLICAAYVLERGPTLEGLVLVCPALAFRVPVPAWLRAGARVLSVVRPTFTQGNGIDVALLSHDQGMVAAARADGKRFATATARWYVESTTAQRCVMAAAERITVPTLVLVADDDALVDPAAAARFAGRIPGAELRRYAGCYHELLNETNREQVLDDLVRWLVRAAGARGA